MNEIFSLTAASMARLIREGELSSEGVVEAHLRRIAENNPALNAIVTLDEGAIHFARQADRAAAKGDFFGPLHGVPFTVKDSFESAGLRTTSGSLALSQHLPVRDADVVARLRAAGGILLGKTNLPPLARGAQTDNALFGRTNNPWDLARTPGGSSGGGAAAVAAGLSPLDIGSDLSGSLCLPAHFCGIYSLKPTGGRISGRGHIASLHPILFPEGLESLRDFPAFGPLARSVEDLKMIFSILSPSPEPGKIAETRIAWTDELPGSSISGQVGGSIKKLAEDLKSAGFQVERSPSNLDFDEALEVAGICIGALDSLSKPAAIRSLRKLSRLLPSIFFPHPLLRGLVKGSSLFPEILSEALQRRKRISAELDAFFEDHDVWICPAFGSTAFSHRLAQVPIEIDGKFVSQRLSTVAPGVVFNLTGHPVVTIPVALSKEGLPIGVQVIGRRGSDESLLEHAERISRHALGFQPPSGSRESGFWRNPEEFKI